jgi:hypothetical protein
MRVTKGMSLIDVVVGTSLLLVVFLALFTLLHASLQVSIVIKNQSTAGAIANSQMESIRSLPYNSVGTFAGIPAGLVAQNSTTTEDGVAYAVRTFIDYYDDPSDGVGVADTNGITTDYKRIKVTVSYPAGGTTKQITLVSSYSPPGIETTLGGGTLQIVVVNALGQPVPGATVHITNSSTTPSVDLTTFSDATGVVFLPGAATSTQYTVNVSKSGYSTSQTYARDVTNQNPTPGYLTVVNNVTTTGTFAIDLLGNLTLNTFLPVATSTFNDSFTDSSKLVTTSGTVVSGGALALSGGFGNYSSSGTALSTTTSPAYLASWGVVSSTINVVNGTTAVVQVVDKNGVLLPDAVLPGNSAGFTSPVNLFGVSTTTYPELALSASLTTNSTSTTPSITSWSLSYQAGPIPLPNVSFTLTGAKTVGTTGAGAAIYKTIVADSTKSNSIDTLSLEWDSYSIAVPYALSPGTSLSESLILGTSTTNAMLVTVTDASAIIVPNATVTLSRSGFSKTLSSSSCGGAYFGNLSAANDYSVVISKGGYPTTSTSGITVGGHTFYGAAF